jgi:hypothetical protein
MKQQAIQYVALDVHQATVVVSVRDEQGSIVMRATVATEAKALVGLVRGLGPRVHIAFEEGTQAQWLHDLLTKHTERVIVCTCVAAESWATRATASMPTGSPGCCASAL